MLGGFTEIKAVLRYMRIAYGIKEKGMKMSDDQMSPRKVQFSVLFYTPYMRNADVKGRPSALQLSW